MSVSGLDSKPYTRNLIPGESVCWEVHRKLNGIEYRYWDPNRSKLAAFLVSRGKTFPFEVKSTVLYLGAANGTTVSHISDILPDGRIFAVEVAKNPFRELLAIAEKRGNIIPILEDANHPEIYERLVGQVEIMYQDISQRNQTEIFIRNSGMLKPGGTGYLMVKARCIDVTASPTRTFEQCGMELESAGFKTVEMVKLDPYQKDHAAFVVRK
ncbi:MAG: fibrillarin-like rRNA/tRNA 2'-O-methyltransferase [Candidatus Thermoplasmatota archaeon]|nr:fibrillarin-like rRNA/tRNA 2'-O-methyltransferase [Euryarchaeota archaeon]MBU4031705.1 fibrillarin-like rRNA/tRNA 2'-O-methyltransferase [Candidatus Thermoplasmatota archaeon]MBU4070946.1 fibrillarin-like rRNA/tRNA 2'-O-methyltransferase [Candidatus Thermoplasmatota archaeon]MBU4143995.1 fibrillarin-like rRNA/tRNA 2'-O-methyltransferase [Candidatus Thermoplasmatota archaeon]MBU4591891.1 fibrillarin-like rRNA/tRNA 2'-O-methyltransferase [Candidatus Thermoplasmatota archaeon]